MRHRATTGSFRWARFRSRPSRRRARSCASRSTANSAAQAACVGRCGAGFDGFPPAGGRSRCRLRRIMPIRHRRCRALLQMISAACHKVQQAERLAAVNRFLRCHHEAVPPRCRASTGSRVARLQREDAASDRLVNRLPPTGYPTSPRRSTSASKSGVSLPRNLA